MLKLLNCFFQIFYHWGNDPIFILIFRKLQTIGVLIRCAQGGPSDLLFVVRVFFIAVHQVQKINVIANYPPYPVHDPFFTPNLYSSTGTSLFSIVGSVKV